jgi:hypothetical protein
MVHGRSQEEVKQKVEEIISTCGLQDINHTILFSTRRFKQRGASYTAPKSTIEASGYIRLKTTKDTA